MKVLLISPFSKPDVGGVESHLEKLTTYLCDKKAIDVTFVTYMPLASNEVPKKYEKFEHLEIIRMPWFGKNWFRKLEAYFPLNMVYLFPGLFYKCLCVYLSRHKEYDVIHAHGFIAGAIAKLLTKYRKKRTVISTHAIYSLKEGSFKAKVFKWLLNDFDVVLAVGEPSLQEIVKIGIPSERVRVHPNWIDVHAYHPEVREKARQVLGLGREDFIVLFVGRMIGIKGELILLEAARICKEQITFVFVGGGPESPKIIDEAKINNKVVYLGKLPDEKMNLAYAAADLFVSPVLYDEGFATVYLEALASGVPVITARRGCLPYFLDEEVAELLDEVNVATVLNAIQNHYKNQESLVEKRKKCRLYAENHFSEKNADIIFDSYKVENTSGI